MPRKIVSAHPEPSLPRNEGGDIDGPSTAVSQARPALGLSGLAVWIRGVQVQDTGRFAPQDEATALVKQLKKKGFAKAGPRRGW